MTIIFPLPYKLVLPLLLCLDVIAIRYKNAFLHVNDMQVCSLIQNYFPMGRLLG